MNEALTDLIERLRDNLVSVMAIFLMVVILLGYLFFTTNSILPQWRLRDELIMRTTIAEEALAQSSQTEQSTIQTLKNQIANAPVELDNAADFLMTETQANQFLSNLYVHASLSDVAIAELQTQSTPDSNTEDLYNIKQFQLRVDGQIENLVNFLTRIEVASQAGYILSNMVMKESAPQDSLTMNITLYTSPLASSDLVLTADTNLSEVVVTPPTEVKELQLVPYIVRSGDTLFSISRRFNVPIAAIRKANSLSGNSVSPEQELLIPH